MSIPKAWGSAIGWLATGLALPLGGRAAVRARARAAERLQPTVAVRTARGTIRFRIPSPDAANMAMKFPRREPETLAWMDVALRPGDCLWDIGANIGFCALYATLTPDVEVVAFEPGAASYAALSANLAVNGVSGRIRALPVALGDSTRLGQFHLTSLAAAGSNNSFGDSRNVYGAFTPAFSQTVLGFAAADLVRQFGLRRPDHIKLDVDGNEAAILAGAAPLLAGVRTLLAQVDMEARGADPARQNALRSLIEQAGFVLDRDQQARYPRATNRVYRKPAV